MEATFEMSKKDAQQKSSQLFLLRIWPDQNGNGPARWEGKVQHVITGETRVFNDWASLSSLLQSMLAEEAEAAARSQVTLSSGAGGSYWDGRES